MTRRSIGFKVLPLLQVLAFGNWFYSSPIEAGVAARCAIARNNTSRSGLDDAKPDRYTWIEPDEDHARHLFVVALGDHGNANESNLVFDQAMQNGADDADALVERGIALRDQGKIEDAI
jgi:hypothetical protein